MSRHGTSCHVMPRHFTSCHAMPRPVLSRHVTSSHVMSRPGTSCHVISCLVMSRHVTSCHVMSRPVLSCHVGCPEGCRYHTASAVYNLVIIIIIIILPPPTLQPNFPTVFKPPATISVPATSTPRPPPSFWFSTSQFCPKIALTQSNLRSNLNCHHIHPMLQPQSKPHYIPPPLPTIAPRRPTLRFPSQGLPPVQRTISTLQPLPSHAAHGPNHSPPSNHSIQVFTRSPTWPTF